MLVRLRFTKLGKIRFTSHRDVARMFERALRRAELPVALTQGFTPRPKLSFGLALSTGHESLAEYLDVDFAPSTEWGVVVDELPDRLTPVLPAGIEVVAAGAVPPGEASLQQQVVCCSWELEAGGVDVALVEAAVAAALAAPQLVATRSRKGHEVTDDLRPSIMALAVAGDGHPPGGVRLRADLATQPRALRPSELLAAVLPDAVERRALRTHQWIECDGERREPLPWRTPAPVPAGAGA